MALTDYDKKNLSSKDQKKIQTATEKWNAANAKGDKAGMAAAAAEAAAVRNKAGYKTDSYGNYSGSYVPSSGSSGGSKGGSSGGAGIKSSYSPYTNLGSTWDANTDYQAIINDAVANGDYVTAAKAEQLRNQKIISTGSNYDTTNKYGGHLDGIDYGTVGKNQMAYGADWEDVLATYNSRYSKASTTEGLQQYANDETQNMMLQYILDNMQQSGNDKAKVSYDEWVQNYKQNNPKQEYESKYDPQMDVLLSQILNRDDFSYDATNDPLYQQYAQMYRREGDRAMRETLAEAAASAGGMNTYAITAAQQANNYYNSQLNDKIPELYQLAYDMYINDKESKVQDLGILQNMDATQYNRYRDTINDYYNDKDFAYGAYQDAVAQGNWQTNFNYNSMLDNRDFMYNDIWQNKQWNYQQAQDNIANDRHDREWNYQVEQNNIANNRYEQETAKEEVWKLIGLGVTPSADLIARAGMNQTDVNLAIAAVQAEQVAKSTSSSRKSSGGGSGLSREPGENVVPEPTAIYDFDKNGNYSNIKTGEQVLTEAEICQEIFENDGKQAVLDYLKESLATGTIPMGTYIDLYGKYSGRKS